MRKVSITDKVLDKYGIIGVFAVLLSAMILIGTWVFVSLLYPFVIFTPVLVLGWMVLKVTGDKDE